MLMNTRTSPDPSTVKAAPRSVTRVLSLFGMLTQYEAGVTLSELSGMLHSPKSSLLLLLRPLVAEGYLLHENSRYRLGPTIYRLASTISATRNLSSLIRPYIAEVASTLSESVYLAVIDRTQAVCSYIEGTDCPQAVRFVLPLGQARPLYSTAAGRVLLAWQDKAWIDSYLRRIKLVPATERTIDTKVGLRAELAKIRDQGYAETLDEGHAGASGVAAPILDSDGQIWAALLVAAPSHRYRQNAKLAVRTLLSVAGRASGAIQALDSQG